MNIKTTGYLSFQSAIYSNPWNYPIGSFLVKVRFRLGLAWLIGMVLPCETIASFIKKCLSILYYLKWFALLVTLACSLLMWPSYLYLVTPASKVAEGLNGHAYMSLQGKCVNCSGVNSFDGGQLFLMLLHQVCQSVGGDAARRQDHG